MTRLLSLVGKNVLFCHWPVPSIEIGRRVPDRLDVEEYDDTAWVSLLAYTIPKLKSDLSPVDIPGNMSQVSLRTYVEYEGLSGVYFINVDIDNRFGTFAGRAGMGLNATLASISIDESEGGFSVRSKRTAVGAQPARFKATFRPKGPVSAVEPGSLDEFLVERHRYFTTARGGVRTWSDANTGSGTVKREPWQLTDATVEIQTNTLFRAIGMETPDQEPIARFSPGFESAMESSQ